MIAFSGQNPYRGVHIGNARGKIALWLDKEQARDLANLYGGDDLGAQELYEAIESAYPEHHIEECAEHREAQNARGAGTTSARHEVGDSLSGPAGTHA